MSESELLEEDHRTSVVGDNQGFDLRRRRRNRGEEGGEEDDDDGEGHSRHCEVVGQRRVQLDRITVSEFDLFFGFYSLQLSLRSESNVLLVLRLRQLNFTIYTNTKDLIIEILKQYQGFQLC